MTNLESVFLMFALVLFFYTLIGGLIAALLQKLGFRFVVGLSKEDAPGFFKLYLVQILTVFVLVAMGYLLFASSLIFNPIFLKIYFTLFGLTPVGILASISAQYVLNIAIYVLIVAALTQAFTKKPLLMAIKSQVITIGLLIITWFAGLALAGAVLLEQLNKFDLIPHESTEAAQTINVPVEAGKTHYGKALDEYEKMVVAFEKTAKSDALCQSEMMNLTVEMIPQLSAMGAEFDQMKGTGNDVSQQDLARYLDLLNRFNKATIEMNNKVPDPNC